jgi:pimeloyl-ACP methyl ester carboxylesterase
MQHRATLGTNVVCIALLCLVGGAEVLANDQGPAQISEGRASTRSGISIHYLQAGPPGSDRALVLIPGWRLPAYLWTEQLKSFSSVIRVVAVDPRSQGESTKTTEGNSPEVRARDLHDLLATLSVTRPVLVGWSQGAQDVAACVQQFGSASVAGVVFVDSPVSIGPAEIEEHKEFSKIILSGIGVYAEHPDLTRHGGVTLQTASSQFGHEQAGRINVEDADRHRDRHVGHGHFWGGPLCGIGEAEQAGNGHCFGSVASPDLLLP